jgi:Cu(I)/Ag(I) efflux system membrane fusion protein
MKTLKILLIYSVVISLLLLIYSCSKSVNVNATDEFWVRGNCEMCKERIEKSVKKLNGIGKVEWDIKSSILKVEFDSNQIKPIQIHQACAAVGHETKLIATTNEIHEALPDCCKKTTTKTGCCGKSCCNPKKCVADGDAKSCDKNCCYTSNCNKSNQNCCKKTGSNS